MTPLVYPVALALHDKRVLVVGGGEIAAGKLDALLLAGATVHVVSPEVLPAIAALAADGTITLHQRGYVSADLDGVFLAIAATDDRALNARVVTEARAARILAQAVDDIPYCDFFAVAIVRRGDLQLGISTNGRSPAFARWLRERFDAQLPANYGALLDALGDARETLRARGAIPRYDQWRVAIDDALIAPGDAGDREAVAASISARLADGLAAAPALEEAPR
jgi:precorrin-2 dehydrogenase/sirohydrochlorin ferrochelatase